MGDKKKTISKESFLNKDILDDAEIRTFPSIDFLDEGKLKIVQKRVDGLIDLLGYAGSPKRISMYLAEELESAGFSERDVFDDEFDFDEKDYFIRDPWIKSGMVIVKEGRLPISQGFNLILAHTDVPCLRIKPKPLKLDSDKPYNFLGVRLSAIAHGGINNYQWMGQQVKIIGDKFAGGQEIPIEFYGIVADASAHVNHKEYGDVQEGFAPERTLEIIVGDVGPKETLKRLGFKSIDEFAQSELYAIPINYPLLIGGENGRLLAAYGHDDLCCVHAAKDAIIDANDPKYTSFIWLSDKEESGESYPTGAEGPFMDRVLDYVIEKNERKQGRQFSARERHLIPLRSSGILADVDIAPYGHDAENMDARSAAKIGLGTFISSGQGLISDTRFVQELMSLSKKGISSNNNLFYQICGDFYDQDTMDLWYYDAPNKFMEKMGRWAVAGVPCASAHSHNEIICPGDEYWTYRLYKRFLESDTGLNK